MFHTPTPPTPPQTTGKSIYLNSHLFSWSNHRLPSGKKKNHEKFTRQSTAEGIDLDPKIFKEIYLPKKNAPATGSVDLSKKQRYWKKMCFLVWCSEKKKKKICTSLLPQVREAWRFTSHQWSSEVHPFVGRGWFLGVSSSLGSQKKHGLSSSNFGSSFWKDGGWLLKKRKKNLWVTGYSMKAEICSHSTRGRFYIRLPKNLKPNRTTKSYLFLICQVPFEFQSDDANTPTVTTFHKKTLNHLNRIKNY